MLLHPNFGWFGKRIWKLIPYGLGLLNASLRKQGFDSWIYDPGFDDESEDKVRAELRQTAPDVVGITTFSTEYTAETRYVCRVVKEELPSACVILGGILPTVLPEEAAADTNVDYAILGEGELRLPQLLRALNTDTSALAAMDGLIHGSPRVIQPLRTFIDDLDSAGVPDYHGIDPARYTNHVNKLCHTVIPRQYPFGITMTTRGCPYKCTFCSAAVVSGRKVRLRSAKHVLSEVNHLVSEYGVREVIFLDDHFLANRARAMDIMRGLKAIGGLTWKCVNVSIWSLDTEVLELMRDSGCYQMTVSVESGNQHVLSNIIKKPVKLAKVPEVLARARNYGFEIISNFVIGFPGETWQQIRETCAYADQLPADLINFHIATPLPRTELMDMCVRDGLIPADKSTLMGYTRAVIRTPEFTPEELEVLRAFEWDRINFSSVQRRETIARMEGISLSELESWRVRTRRNVGKTIEFNEALQAGGK